MSRYSMYPFSCTTAAGALAFTQLDRQGCTPNAVLSSIIPGGSVDRQMTCMSNATPMLEATTRDLLTFFTAVSPSSVLPFTAGVFRLQKRDEGGTFLAGLNHEVYNCARGVIVPGSISAAQDDPEGAGLTFGASILYDGTNRPITRSTLQTFAAAPTPAFVSRYFMGPAFIDSVQIPNIERTSIDFGVHYNAKGFNGSPFPTEGSIIVREPKISLTSTAAAIDAAVDIFLRSLTTDVRCFFQRSLDGSDRVAADVASHLSISAQSGSWNTESISTQGNEDGSVTLNFTPTAALSVNVATIIA